MVTQPNTPLGDVEAWGLTRAEALQYYRRLSRFHTRRALKYSAKAAHYSRMATAWSAVSIVCLLMVLLLQVAE